MEYSRQAKRAITGATKLSKSLKHSYVGTEHLLISIIEQEGFELKWGYKRFLA